jgi:NTP pyrophosphatase (non-canonical NTP hydrolase)
MYEQLAEECNELAKAALKKARKIRNENPTPIDESEIDANVIEEATDVLIVMDNLNIGFDEDIYKSKCQRWINRLKGKGDYENHTS